jgi:hypothetical protein
MQESKAWDSFIIFLSIDLFNKYIILRSQDMPKMCAFTKFEKNETENYLICQLKMIPTFIFVPN